MKYLLFAILVLLLLLPSQIFAETTLGKPVYLNKQENAWVQVLCINGYEFILIASDTLSSDKYNLMQIFTENGKAKQCNENKK